MIAANIVLWNLIYNKVGNASFGNVMDAIAIYAGSIPIIHFNQLPLLIFHSERHEKGYLIAIRDAQQACG